MKNIIFVFVIIFSLLSLSCAKSEMITGPMGPAGPSGGSGNDGSDGNDGNNGNDGSDGNDGNNGNDGSDGLSPVIAQEVLFAMNHSAIQEPSNNTRSPLLPGIERNALDFSKGNFIRIFVDDIGNNISTTGQYILQYNESTLKGQIFDIINENINSSSRARLARRVTSDVISLGTPSTKISDSKRTIEVIIPIVAKSGYVLAANTPNKYIVKIYIEDSDYRFTHNFDDDQWVK